MMRARGVWILFLSMLAVLAIAYGIFINVTTTEIINEQGVLLEQQQEQLDGDKYKYILENYYTQSVYQLSDTMKNINANLGKLSVSSNRTLQQKFLLLIEGQATSASFDLALLPIENTGVVQKCLKYVNQLADYSKILNERLSNGGKLTDADKNNLDEMEKISYPLMTALNKMAINGTTFVNSTNVGGSTSVEIEDIDENTFDYPQLIYDGPYSDAIVDKDLATGEKISIGHGKSYIEEVMAQYDVASVEYIDTVDNKARVHVYEMITNSNEVFRISLTMDGRVLQMNGHTNDSQTPIAKDMDNFKKIAMQFANKLGYDVRPIWVSEPIENRVYVNMCYVQGDTIMYPDIVKVTINATNGKVVGLEAYGYLANHKERTLPTDYYNLEKAMARLQNVEIVGINKAVVPHGQREYNCYEFVCEKGDNTYFIYLDMTTLQERDIFKVVEGIEGYSVI